MSEAPYTLPESLERFFIDPSGCGGDGTAAACCPPSSEGCEW
jgi:hypothetical protein